MLHGLRHVLTPGSPAYGALKIAAVAGAFGLHYAVRRQSRRNDDDPTPEAPPEPAPRPAPHPRSKKKRRPRGR